MLIILHDFDVIQILTGIQLVFDIPKSIEPTNSTPLKNGTFSKETRLEIHNLIRYNDIQLKYRESTQPYY